MSPTPPPPPPPPPPLPLPKEEPKDETMDVDVDLLNASSANGTLGSCITSGLDGVKTEKAEGDDGEDVSRVKKALDF